MILVLSSSRRSSSAATKARSHDTTVGRCLLTEVVPDSVEFEDSTTRPSAKSSVAVLSTWSSVPVEPKRPSSWPTRCALGVMSTPRARASPSPSKTSAFRMRKRRLDSATG